MQQRAYRTTAVALFACSRKRGILFSPRGRYGMLRARRRPPAPDTAENADDRQYDVRDPREAYPEHYNALLDPVTWGLVLLYAASYVVSSSVMQWAGLDAGATRVNASFLALLMHSAGSISVTSYVMFFAGACF